MSLSKTIIYDNVDAVKALAEQGAPINVIDEYGYTPLIQTAIMDDIEKTKVILDAGAKVNFPDLTGRTALHWAVDNNNLALCELLLKNKANPNAYTPAGQPVLTMPLLRHQTQIKALLYRYGASLNFAKDFIHAKLLGHRFALTHRVDIVDPITKTFIEINYEGFFLEFTIAIMHNSLMQFRNHFGARKLRNAFKLLDKVIECFSIASELVKHQHYNIDLKAHEQKLHKLLSLDPLIIPVAYEGHAISLVRFGSLLAYCDRGEFGKEHGALNIFRVHNRAALSPSLFHTLLYTRTPKTFVQRDLFELLGVELITQLPLSPQITGNCSWANVEASILALFFLLQLQKTDMTPEAIRTIEESSFYLFNEWGQWDKDNALNLFIEDFKAASTPRRISKAEVLASILFQYLDYHNHRDIKKAQKILPILLHPEVSFILKNYLEVFYREHKTKGGQKLAEILDDFGIDEELIQ